MTTELTAGGRASLLQRRHLSAALERADQAIERATRAVDISRPYPLKHSACREVLARIQRDSGGGSTPPRRATV